jgi:hypothetical protein
MSTDRVPAGGCTAWGETMTENGGPAEPHHLDAALAALRRARPKPTVTDAAEILRQAVAADGAIWPESSLRRIARTVVEPSWPLRHPLEFLRERATHGWGDSEQTIGSPIDSEHDGLESARRERVALDLRAHDAVKGVEFLADRPGGVGVVLTPWTQSVADVVRRICLPYRVYFLDALPEVDADPPHNTMDT